MRQTEVAYLYQCWSKEYHSTEFVYASPAAVRDFREWLYSTVDMSDDDYFPTRMDEKEMVAEFMKQAGKAEKVEETVHANG